MQTATKLGLFVGCLVVAVVAGWMLGRTTAVLVPDLIVPGGEPVHSHSAALPRPAPVVVIPEEIR